MLQVVPHIVHARIHLHCCTPIAQQEVDPVVSQVEATLSRLQLPSNLHVLAYHTAPFTETELQSCVSPPPPPHTTPLSRKHTTHTPQQPTQVNAPTTRLHTAHWSTGNTRTASTWKQLTFSYHTHAHTHTTNHRQRVQLRTNRFRAEFFLIKTPYFG